MDALLQTVTQTVAHDVRGLVYAAQLEVPALVEKDPPGFGWHLPLGFAALAAAGTLLVAAGGVQWEVQRARESTPRKGNTHMHKHKLRTVPLKVG
jgi:hypothetical protein